MPGPGMGMGAAPARQQMARIDPAQIPRPVVNQSQEVQVGGREQQQQWQLCVVLRKMG